MILKKLCLFGVRGEITYDGDTLDRTFEVSKDWKESKFKLCQIYSFYLIILVVISLICTFKPFSKLILQVKIRERTNDLWWLKES